MNFTLDLTGVVITVLGLIVNAILAWAAKRIVPGVQKWLYARTTEQQRQTLWNVTLGLVKSAQQLYDEGMLPVPRLEYVKESLASRGLNVDIDMVKAAVREINIQVGQFFQTAVTGKAEEGTTETTTTEITVEAEVGEAPAEKPLYPDGTTVEA